MLSESSVSILVNLLLERRISLKQICITYNAFSDGTSPLLMSWIYGGQLSSPQVITTTYHLYYTCIF